MGYSITRDEFRAAIAHALKDAPGLPSKTRQDLTELAGNANKITYGAYIVEQPSPFYHGCYCPLTALDPTIAYRIKALAESDFIYSFDNYMTGFGIPPGTEIEIINAYN